MEEQEQVARARFGRDHWSMLAYIESCAVERQAVDAQRIRVNPATHPDLAQEGPRTRAWKNEWGTRLSDGSRLANHDDWDCAMDLGAAGLLLELPGRQLALTDEGWAVVQVLRRYKAAGGSFATFSGVEAAQQGFTLSLADAREAVIATGMMVRFFANVEHRVQENERPDPMLEQAERDRIAADVMFEHALGRYCDLRAERLVDIGRSMEHDGA